MAIARRNATAGPQLSGYVFQLERALYHLATAEDGTTIAVEFPDDVAVLREGKPALVEQDKNTVTPGRDMLRNRSKALWRTLQIWLGLHEGPDSATCYRYLIVTNTASTDTIASALKRRQTNEISAAEAVAILRSDSGPKSKSQIQTTIDDVLGRSDAVLAALIAKIEIVESGSLLDSRKVLTNALAIDPGVDAETVLDSLLGWSTNLLRILWQKGKIGLIDRRAFVAQCRLVERSLIRQRLLPRPARDVVPDDQDRARVKARPFVDHLGRIDITEDVVLEAIDHFLQFNIEKHRLTTQGEIPDREWLDRGDRLTTRWRGVIRQVTLDLPAETDLVRGQHILARSTTGYHEPLGGQDCGELYMTAGHYHRLADENTVWWDPTFKTRK